MINAGILDGDTVIIRATQHRQYRRYRRRAGAITTKRRFEASVGPPRGDSIALEAANPAYETAALWSGSHLNIQGTFVGLIRRY